MVSKLKSHYEMITRNNLITTSANKLKKNMIIKVDVNMKVRTMKMKMKKKKERQNEREKDKEWQTNFICWRPNEVFMKECGDKHDILWTQSKARIQEIMEIQVQHMIEQEPALKPPRLPTELKKIIYGDRLKEFEYNDDEDQDKNEKTTNENANETNNTNNISNEKMSKVVHWSNVFDEDKTNWLIQQIVDLVQKNEKNK